MTAEIILDIEVAEFISWLVEKNRLKEFVNRGSYYVLKPRIVDDFLEVKLLVSSEATPKEWVDFDQIKANWERETASIEGAENVVEQGIVQLQGVDGQDIALFEFNKKEMNTSEAIERIEAQMRISLNEDNPLDAAEERLKKEGIRRLYVTDFANTNVI